MGVGCLFALLTGCALAPVVPQEGALPSMPLTDLISNVDAYVGQTVVAGGHVLEVANQQDQTRILAVQVPLGAGQRLKSKDLSEGRLVLIYDGFIDPEVYEKNREITVRGEILGGAADDPEAPYPYLRIHLQNIYLWPEKKLSDPTPCPGHGLLHPWFRYYPNYPYYVYPYPKLQRGERTESEE
jgi:outer membrane lipoprotein